MNIRVPYVTFILFLLVTATTLAQKKVLFFQTDWGNTLPVGEFLERASLAGYDGVELWMPSSDEDKKALKKGLDKHRLEVIFLHGTDRSLSPEQALVAYEKGLLDILAWKPMKINSHTGNDFWSNEENLKFLELTKRISDETGIPIVHETHRGRFSYQLPNTAEIVKLFPELRLTLDISHWMVVHERLIRINDPALQTILPQVDHIHARVGFEEGPQVNNPAAPEWQNTLEAHLTIWESIITSSKLKIFTITSEFGPPPYMPTAPYTNAQLADQWEANLFMMNVLKDRLAHD